MSIEFTCPVKRRSHRRLTIRVEGPTIGRSGHDHGRNRLCCLRARVRCLLNEGHDSAPSDSPSATHLHCLRNRARPPAYLVTAFNSITHEWVSPLAVIVFIRSAISRDQFAPTLTDHLQRRQSCRGWHPPKSPDRQQNAYTRCRCTCRSVSPLPAMGIGKVLASSSRAINSPHLTRTGDAMSCAIG